MSPADSALRTLREHIALCEEALRLEERENVALASAADPIDLRAEREALLPRLNRSVAALKELGVRGCSPGTDPTLSPLLRAAQEITIKTVTLGRENERARLLRGFVPPKHLPSPHRERPHFVAQLYRRNGP